MKHIITFFLALLPFMAQAQTVVNPDYEYRVSSIFSIRSIERTKDCTRVNLRATFRPNWWFSFDKGDKIINADNPGQEFLPTAIEGLEFGEHRFMGQDGVHDFTVVYPPLPDGIKRIDMSGEGTLIYKGVSLTDTRRDPFVSQREEWMDAHPESPMKEMVRMGQPMTEKQFYNIGTATVRGQIGHYDKRLGMKCIIFPGDPVFRSYGNVVNIAPDGTFTATFAISGPATLDVYFQHSSFGYNSSNPLYIEPGQTIDFFVDREDDILAYDRGRGLLPYVPMVLRGPLAEVNRQIREAPVLENWLPNKDRDVKDNLASLLRHYNADMPAIRHYLKRSDLLPKAKQYIETDARIMLAARQMQIPEYLFSEKGEQIIATMDSSYYDFLREIDLNDITQFATMGGIFFLNEFESKSSWIFNKTVWNNALEDNTEGSGALHHCRAAALGYKSLPVAEQLTLLANRGRVWYKMHDVVSGLWDIEQLNANDLEDDQKLISLPEVDRNVKHPKLKAMNKRLTKECHSMMAKIKSMASERLQWQDEHPIVEQPNIDKPYDAATFFCLDSVTINVKIGRYDKSKPMVACAMMFSSDDMDKTDDVPVADDGTFTLRIEVTNPGIALVAIGDADDKNYHYRSDSCMELYVEPGHTTNVYIDSHEIAEPHKKIEYTERSNLSTMSGILHYRKRFDTSDEALDKPLEEAKGIVRTQWEEYRNDMYGYCSRLALDRPVQFIKSDIAASRALALGDMLLQRQARQHKDENSLEFVPLVNGILQQVDLDYFSFLRELPKDDVAMAATPDGHKLMRMIGGGSWCGYVLDALLAGKKTFTEEDVRNNFFNMDDVLQRRLAFYGCDTLPLFEQASYLKYVRFCMKHYGRMEPEDAAPWFDSVRATADKYITHPGLHRVLDQIIDRNK